jgi:ketosteroid isomerase-like protein
MMGLGACTPAPDLEAEGQALMQLSREWSASIPTASIDSVMSLWAEDAVMLPPGSPPLEGKAAIRSYVEAAGQVPGFQISWEPVSVHIAASGDMGYMIERNTITVNDSLGNPVTTHNKVVTVWRKDAAGNWKNVVDMWNESPAPVR